MSRPTLIIPPEAADPDLWRKVVDGAQSLAISLATAVVILIVTLWLSGWASRLVRRLLGRLPRTRGDATLQGFFGSLARYLVIILGLIAVLTEIGVETTSIIAVLGAASLALGLALQGTLSNVAAGVMLLIFRPYKVGDFVEVAGKRGTVQALDLFTTELTTPENIKLIAPNGKVFGEFILNFTAHPTRRLDMVFHVDFEADMDAVRALLLKAAARQSCVLAEPAPMAEILNVLDNWTDVALRVWVDAEHCAADTSMVRSDIIAACLAAMAAAGVPPAYPHQVAVLRAPA